MIDVKCIVLVSKDIEIFLNDLRYLVKHSGLQIRPEDEYVSYTFDMIYKEINKKVTLGYSIHAKNQ